MKKLLLILSIFASIQSLHSMEPHKQFDYMTTLSAEIQTNIILQSIEPSHDSVRSNNVGSNKVFKNIRSLACINKKFNSLVNDPFVVRSIINSVVKTLNMLNKTLNILNIQAAKYLKIQDIEAYIRRSEGLISNIKNPKRVKELIQLGADVNFNNALLYNAINTENATNIKLIKQIIVAGANIDAINPRDGKTPLIKATSHGNIKVVQLLLDNHANPNTRSISYRNHEKTTTALIEAVERYIYNKRDLTIITLLLQAKADPTLKNSCAQTALDIAADFPRKYIPRSTKQIKFSDDVQLDAVDDPDSFILKELLEDAIKNIQQPRK